MIVAGIGCRRGASASAIEDVLRVALAQGRLKRGALDALATHHEKGEEPGLRQVAERWALKLVLPSMAELADVAKYTATVSPRSLAAKGLPSVCETAALAAAGRSARLLVARVATKEATCAIAVGEGSIGRGPTGYFPVGDGL
jgi:cobalt-precorrin 5A hydrolase